jgi:transglutaminase-like putative cysteine protease
MKPARASLYLACFVGLAVTATLALDRMGRPSIAATLVWVAVVATLAGAPGLVHRRAWPLALALLPLGAWFILRTQMPVPSELRGFGEQAGFYAEQLTSGARTYASHRFPIEFATAGDLKLLLSLILYAVVGLAAFIALSLRWVVPAVVLLIVPLAFGLTVDGEERAIGLSVWFLLFACLMLLTSRSLRRPTWRLGDTVAGAGLAALAVVLALGALGATPLAESRPWQDWRSWDVNVSHDARFVFDSMEGYAGLLDPDNDEPVMRVTSPLASYWRANALDGFDGTAWFSEQSKRNRLRAERDGGSYTYDVPAADLVPPGTRVRQTFEVGAMQIDYFFTGGVAEQLVFGKDVPVQLSGTSALGVDRPLGPGVRYGGIAVVPTPTPLQLVARGRDYPKHVLRQAQLPFPTPSQSAATATEADWRDAMAETPEHGEWLDLYRLNRQIVGEATDPYEIALKIEEFLRLNYAYSLTPPSPQQESPYAAFLTTTGQGFCQHFAGAMAVLLRFNGVPARVAVGFATGVRVADDTFIVSRNDAHAWVEAYFPGVGWVMFEPTPGQRVPGPGASSTSAEFSDPFAFINQVDSTAATRERPEADTPRGLQEDVSAGVSEEVAETPAATRATPRLLPWALAGGAVALLVAWPVGRALLRRRGLRRGDAERRLRAALALLYADLDDFGVDAPRSQTLEETAVWLREHLGLDAADVVARAQAVLFGGRAATVDDVAAVAALRRELLGRLRAHAGRRRALLALYGLRRPPATVPRRRPALPLRPYA